MTHFLAKAWACIVLLGLFGVGIAYWIWFFSYGHIDFTFYDWPKDSRYYAVLQSSLNNGTIPYYVAEEFHGTHQFLALPETVLSPQIVLLHFMEIGPFILVNTLFLYSLGFLGCWLIRRRYRLSLVPFTLLFLLFSFNGHITSHLAVGHTMWNGYFLLPFFCLFVLELVETARLRTALKLALVLLAMILQGSFHLVIWCWMFVAILALVQWRLFKPALLALILSGLLAFFRLLPAAIAFWQLGRVHHEDYKFISGYPGLTLLLEAFTVVHKHDYYWYGGFFNRNAWWEYDFFMGFLGLAFLVYGGIVLRLSRSPSLKVFRYSALDVPLAVLTVWSMGDAYALIAKLPIPLLNGERVSSRFLVIPVVLLLTLAAIRLQRVLDQKRFRWRAGLLWWCAIVQMSFLLGLHSYAWRPETLAKENAPSHWDAGMVLEQLGEPDRLYKATVNGSLLVSAVALAGWCLLFWYAPRLEEAPGANAEKPERRQREL